MTDIFLPEKRRDLMSRVRNRDTDIETAVRKRLWKSGYRYRVRSKIFGKPDIVFRKYRLVIFCDGDFWHGKNYPSEKKNYKKFWKDKILINIKRDKEVNRRLKEGGWTVLRFWKTDILKNLDECVEKIDKHLKHSSAGIRKLILKH